MKKIISKQSAVILILILNFTITVLGCNANGVNDIKHNPSDIDVLSYIEQKINNFNNINESKKQCEIVSKENSKLGHKYLKFNLGDGSNIQFNINTGSIYIEKESIYRNEESNIRMELNGINAEETRIYVYYKTGSIWCEYKVNDFDNPIPDDGNYEKANFIIKESIKAEELQQLYFEAQSIYNNMKEIYLKQSL